MLEIKAKACSRAARVLVRDSLAPHVNVKVFVRTQQTAGMQIICTMTISEMTIERQVNNLSFSFLPGNDEPLLRTVGQQHDVSGHVPSSLWARFYRLAPDLFWVFFILLYGRRVLFHDNTQAISRFHVTSLKRGASCFHLQKLEEKTHFSYAAVCKVNIYIFLNESQVT